MKTTTYLFAALTFIGFISCTKDVAFLHEKGLYNSLSDFYSENGIPMQTYTIDNATGGNFTSPQGTFVSIPSNTFVDDNYNLISGNVTIEFKDLYKKSDMLFANMPPTTNTGILKSAGEFYIKATYNNSNVWISSIKKITVTQPSFNQPIDTSMRPFRFGQDNVNNFVGGNQTWFYNPYDTLLTSTSNYIFSLYQFNNLSALTGTWCNSDDPTYFSAFPQTILTLHPKDSLKDFSVDVFLVFTGVNAMVHLSPDGIDFSYQYAPIGLSCTAVALGVKDGHFYASFTPFTVGANQTVNFSLQQMSVADFKTQLEALN